MSPGSITTDRADKPTEYAMAGIGHYWRFELDDDHLTAFRHQLDPTTGTYAPAGVDSDKRTVSSPFDFQPDFAELY